MVNTFCRSYDNCQDLPEVQEIILAYESKLGSQCMASGQDEEDQIILSLKALKTIGHLIRAQDVLEKCYTEYSNSMYVRLAALDTIQKLSCGGSHSFYPKLFTTFSNTAFDSELRIGAYLALMSCPARSTVNVVKHVLTAEPVNQGLLKEHFLKYFYKKDCHEKLILMFFRPFETHEKRLHNK